MKKVVEGTVGIKNAIQVNEAEVKAHLGELARQSVEETINGILDAGGPIMSGQALCAQGNEGGYSGGALHESSADASRRSFG